MRYEIISHDGVLEVKTYGDAELKGFYDFLQDIVSHEAWHPGGALLVNHRDLNAGPLAASHMHDIVAMGQFFRPRMGKARVAILVGRDLEYGLGRMWQTFASIDKEEIRELFRSRDEAISWLKNED